MGVWTSLSPEEAAITRRACPGGWQKLLRWAVLLMPSQPMQHLGEEEEEKEEAARPRHCLKAALGAGWDEPQGE